MIRVDCEESSFQVYTPFGQGMHNGQSFLFMGCIVPLRWVHFLRCECHRLGSLALVLHEYGTHSKVRCVSGDLKREFWIGNDQHWCFSHLFLEFFHSLGTEWGPGVGSIFMGEVCQWGHKLGVVQDELSIVIAETQE